MNRVIEFVSVVRTESNQLSFVEPGSSSEHPAVALDLPEGRRSFTLEFSACPNPVCTCHTLGVSLRPSDGPDASKIALTFGFEDERVSMENEVENRAVADAFVRRFSGDDWIVLTKIFFRLKADCSEISDASEIHSQFPEDILADPGCLLAYKEVFPWSADLEFDLNAVSWIPLERYCTNPDCDCTSVLVEFIPRAATTNAPRKRTRSDDATFIYFNYRGATQRVEREGAKRFASPEELIDALQAACPNWKSRFERRHRVLVQWHRRARASLPGSVGALAQATRPRNVGRNEPCPCGSGKKYKNCCLNRS